MDFDGKEKHGQIIDLEIETEPNFLLPQTCSVSSGSLIGNHLNQLNPFDYK